TPSACPTDVELVAFHVGDLPAADLDRVADHVEGCPACDARLRKMEGQADPVLQALRQTGPAAPDPAHFAATHVAGPPRAAGPAAPPTQEVPGYVLLDQLGQGGMGVVHKALHLKLKRLVALKRLRATSVWDRDRFHREAEAVARLEHPNIVQI